MDERTQLMTAIAELKAQTQAADQRHRERADATEKRIGEQIAQFKDEVQADVHEVSEQFTQFRSEVVTALLGNGHNEGLHERVRNTESRILRIENWKDKAEQEAQTQRKEIRGAFWGVLASIVLALVLAIGPKVWAALIAPMPLQQSSNP